MGTDGMGTNHETHAALVWTLGIVHTHTCRQSSINWHHLSLPHN